MSLIVSFIAGSAGCGETPWSPPATRPTDTVAFTDSVDITILIADSSGTEIERGSTATYYCPDCSSDSLPFTVTGSQPWDLGFIRLQLSSTGDTVFTAYTVYDGRGHVDCPGGCVSWVFLPRSYEYRYDAASVEEFSPLYPFTRDTVRTPVWNTLQYSPAIIPFSSHPRYRLALYHHLPTAGAGGPGDSRWVVILVGRQVAAS